MRRYLKLTVLLPLSLAFTACSQEAEETSSKQVEEYFTGSPDEFWQLMIACYDEHGIESEQQGNSLGVSSTLDTEDFLPIQEECLSRIPPMPETEQLPEDQLRRMHSWRVEQYECMVENGYLTGQPLSFEEFMNRVEEDNSLWSGLNELDSADIPAAQTTCPAPLDEW